MPLSPTISGSKKREQELRAGRICAIQALMDVGWRSKLEALNSSVAITELSSDLLTQIISVGDDRAPIWPTGFVGSISHSPNWTWAVAAPLNKLKNVGIDTEAVLSLDSYEVVRQEIGSLSEWSLLNNQSLRPELETTLMFSAKEAYFKLWYPIVHQFYDFEDVILTDVSPNDCDSDNVADNPSLSLYFRTRSESAGCHFRLDQSSLTRVRVLWNDADVFSAAWLAASID